MSTIHPHSPFSAPITILSYIAESDVVYAPNCNHAESRHRRIWQYFSTGGVFKARIKACRSIQKEMERFAEHCDDSATPESPYLGVKLYFEYRINEGRKRKKDKVHRFYLLDVNLMFSIPPLINMVLNIILGMILTAILMKRKKFLKLFAFRLTILELLIIMDYFI